MTGQPDPIMPVRVEKVSWEVKVVQLCLILLPLLVPDMFLNLWGEGVVKAVREVRARTEIMLKMEAEAVTDKIAIVYKVEPEVEVMEKMEGEVEKVESAE